MILQILSMFFATSIEGAIVFAMSPIFAKIIGRIVLGERSTRLQMLFIVMTVTALIVLIILINAVASASDIQRVEDENGNAYSVFVYAEQVDDAGNLSWAFKDGTGNWTGTGSFAQKTRTLFVIDSPNNYYTVVTNNWTGEKFWTRDFANINQTRTNISFTPVRLPPPFSK